MEIALLSFHTLKPRCPIQLLKNVCLLGTLLVAACDGNSSSPSSGLVSESGLNNDSLNGGLTGRVVTANRDLLPIEIDLSAGSSRILPLESIQSALPNENWEGGRVIQGYFTANIDGSGYIHSIMNCRRNDDADAIYRHDSCVATYDRSFARQSLFVLPDVQIDGAAKLSRSGEFVAFNEYEHLGNSFSQLYIVRVDTRSLLDSYLIPPLPGGRVGSGQAPFAWGPDDTLVYSVPSDERIALYITSPLTWTPVNTINLSAYLEGEVSSLEFSPDGSRILIGYNPPGLLNGVVLILDLDTLTFTTPVIDELDIDVMSLDEMQGNLVSPRWSPDGQYIMVLSEGSGAGPIVDVTTGSATVIAARNTLYAVPADAVRTVVNGDQPTAAIAIAARRVTGGELTTSFPGMLTFDYPFYDWVP